MCREKQCSVCTMPTHSYRIANMMFVLLDGVRMINIEIPWEPLRALQIKKRSIPKWDRFFFRWRFSCLSIETEASNCILNEIETPFKNVDFFQCEIEAADDWIEEFNNENLLRDQRHQELEGIFLVFFSSIGEKKNNFYENGQDSTLNESKLFRMVLINKFLCC